MPKMNEDQPKVTRTGPIAPSAHMADIQPALKEAVAVATKFSTDLKQQMDEFKTRVDYMDGLRSILEGLVKTSKGEITSSLQAALGAITDARYAAVNDILNTVGEPE